MRGILQRLSRSVAERKAMIDRDHALPLIAQARQLGISRGSIYYLPRPVSDSDLAVMRRIDELHLLYPFAGSRMLRDLLRQEGLAVGRLHVATLMKRMGLEAIYRRPNTSKPAPGHKIYPYLLRKLAVTRPNQVWATGITYVPMERGFVYLVAIVDWFTRRVLAWRVSISLDVGFCIEALEEALARYGRPTMLRPAVVGLRSLACGSTAIRGRSSRARRSLPSFTARRSPSAWTARAAGVTTCSLSASGAR